MTVKELIEKLQEFDPDLEVQVYPDTMEGCVYEIVDIKDQDEANIWIYAA